MSDDTRPISVAELLARNGTIGSPPVSGHRRRKRRNAVSVAELTGELPVIQTGEIPIVGDDESTGDDEPLVRYSESESAETVVVYSSAPEPAAVEPADGGAAPEGAPDYSDAPDHTPDYTAAAVDVVEEAVEIPAARPEEPAEAEPPAPRRGKSAHPRSAIPLARRRRGPERSHDPRPRRRSAGAEQMAYDPVDEAVDLSELVAEQVPQAEVEELRSYLHSADGTLFSGETVADDIARRAVVSEYDEDDDQTYTDEDYAPDDVTARDSEAARRGPLRVLGSSVVAIVQSLLAVVFGAGLFIAFDQLWRWNHIVALALSTLVIVALVVGVHVVRKTEDFVSILIAVAVGILVTFGPLALQST